MTALRLAGLLLLFALELLLWPLALLAAAPGTRGEGRLPAGGE
jgi:hypothetical protein